MCCRALTILYTVILAMLYGPDQIFKNNIQVIRLSLKKQLLDIHFLFGI